MDIFSAVNLFVQERRCSPVLTAGRCAPPPSVLVERSCRQTKNVETSSGKNRRIVLPIPRTRLRMEQSPPFWTTPRQSTPPLAASHTSAAKSKPRTPDRNHTADPEKPTKHPPAPEDDDGHFFRRQSLRAGTSVQSCIDGRSLRTPAFRACGTFLQADEKRRNVQREEPQNRSPNTENSSPDGTISSFLDDSTAINASSRSQSHLRSEIKASHARPEPYGGSRKTNETPSCARRRRWTFFPPSISSCRNVGAVLY